MVDSRPSVAHPAGRLVAALLLATAILAHAASAEGSGGQVRGWGGGGRRPHLVLGPRRQPPCRVPRAGPLYPCTALLADTAHTSATLWDHALELTPTFPLPPSPPRVSSSDTPPPRPATPPATPPWSPTWRRWRPPPALAVGCWGKRRVPSAACWARRRPLLLLSPWAPSAPPSLSTMPKSPPQTWTGCWPR